MTEKNISNVTPRISTFTYLFVPFVFAVVRKAVLWSMSMFTFSHAQQQKSTKTRMACIRC